MLLFQLFLLSISIFSFVSLWLSTTLDDNAAIVSISCSHCTMGIGTHSTLKQDSALVSLTSYIVIASSRAMANTAGLNRIKVDIFITPPSNVGKNGFVNGIRGGDAIVMRICFQL